MATIREDAQNTVEYGLIVLAVVVVVLIGVASFGSLIEPLLADLAGDATTLGT